MDEKTKKAFDFAQESSKQVISLSTGVIALSITFSKDFLQHVSSTARVFALWSWGAYLAAVLFGLWTLLALTGTLDAKAGVPVSIRGWNVVLPASLQILAFVLGLVLSVIFGIVATRGAP
jgi:hypothetical protein